MQIIGTNVLATQSLLTTTVEAGSNLQINTTAARDNQADIIFNAAVDNAFNAADREYIGQRHTWSGGHSSEAHQAIIDRVQARLEAQGLDVWEVSTKEKRKGELETTFRFSWLHADPTASHLAGQLRQSSERARDIVAANVAARVLNEAYYGADREESSSTFRWNTSYKFEEITSAIADRVVKTLEQGGLTVVSELTKDYDGNYDAIFKLSWNAQ